MPWPASYSPGTQPKSRGPPPPPPPPPPIGGPETTNRPETESEPEAYKLQGSTWAERKRDRDRIRAEARKGKRPMPATMGTGSTPAQAEPAEPRPLLPATPPPVCNRMGFEWGGKPLPCECESWPQYLRQGQRDGYVERLSGELEVRDGVVELQPPTVAYTKVAWWKPGYGVGGCYYNGMLSGAYRCRGPDGTEKIVAMTT